MSPGGEEAAVRHPAEKQHRNPPGLPDIPGGWKQSSVRLPDRTIRLELPAMPDAFLDDPEVLRASDETGHMPYWAHLWPAARHLAESILRTEWPAATSALELGSGIGLVGIAGMMAGLQVTFSDNDRMSLQVARHNAALNSVHPAGAAWLDWRDASASELTATFPFVFGSDVLYDTTLHGPVIDVLDRLLADQGTCWLGDPGRVAFRDFVQRARERGYVTSMMDRSGNVSECLTGQPGRFRVLILRRACLHAMSASGPG